MGPTSFPILPTNPPVTPFGTTTKHPSSPPKSSAKDPTAICRVNSPSARDKVNPARSNSSSTDPMNPSIAANFANPTSAMAAESTSMKKERKPPKARFGKDCPKVTGSSTLPTEN